MDVIRGTERPKWKRRWWAPRPNLRLVRDVQAPQSGEGPYALAMIGSFGLFVLAFAIFMGAWTGSPGR